MANMSGELHGNFEEQSAGRRSDEGSPTEGVSDILTQIDHCQNQLITRTPSSKFTVHRQPQTTSKVEK
eukprot:CAMPEP_0184687660 /NCGR_PEP_ID=MMETSP0312-20130426/27216_1 /TAXON_ID=31354 /ORGANISM="Compsopogon coeruleus, Strain SAG 36.94" /LENGTH=67 /DNA_ID=CAMNT_0027144039 /DNA_START=2053 /DNA_END=2253 /DNA_ORIENTATION=-